MSGDLENLNEQDFLTIKQWNLENDPFAAVKDYSATKTERRWIAKDQIETYKEYVRKRE